MEVSEQIVADLMSKIGEDVSRAMLRSIDLSPEPKLPVAIAGAAAAIGIVTALLDELSGNEMKKGPTNANIMLAGLLAARYGIGGDGVEEAYLDIDALKAAGRSPEPTP